MAAPIDAEEVLARFEELSVLESEFEDAELELIRKSTALNQPLWNKRAEIVAKIPHFWTLVLEQIPVELETFIQPTDFKLFTECLQTIEVSRFEIDDPKGSPRSFSIKFGFGENEYFFNKELEKKFWYRKSKDWAGLVSEPVKIVWKKGKDLTGGLTDAAYELAQAKKTLAKSSGGKAKAKAEAELPEYKALATKIEENTEGAPSFFTWFGFVSSYKCISPEESEEAEKEERERIEKLKRGEKLDDEEDEEDDEIDYQETEVFPQGDECATLLAEDMWPSALRYYKQAHEADDEDLSEIDVDDMDEDDSDGEIDIRGLVGKGRSNASASPPSKKQRKA
ncbi:hypothetical protein DM02DRAFT_614007 [Periconia macrospinosa]|uniref:NAP family protein n=1 Tax=Periconia macrospinosa TaxID=97972 RepID=A0A2V1DUL3_9PLEO|nr:hypothetical protein DM02DRAFT_614007 [Periconia macrospinosa]